MDASNRQTNKQTTYSGEDLNRFLGGFCWEDVMPGIGFFFVYQCCKQYKNLVVKEISF